MLQVRDPENVKRLENKVCRLFCHNPSLPTSSCVFSTPSVPSNMQPSSVVSFVGSPGFTLSTEKQRSRSANEIMETDEPLHS